MSPKDIAEKILNCKTYDIPDIQTLARAYLDATKELDTTKAALSELEKENYRIRCEKQYDLNTISQLQFEINTCLAHSVATDANQILESRKLNYEITKLIGEIADLSDLLSAKNQAIDYWYEKLKQKQSEITKLKEENKDLKYLLDSINKHVIPGELDSSEAATEIIKKQREEIKELKGLFSVQIDIHDRIVALEKKLDIAVNRFKEINNEELSNQRPGGGYSKSAKLSFNAIKEIEGDKNDKRKINV